MNQKGNEPMTTLHARIPVDLMESIELSAERAGVSKSEYIRLALEYVQGKGLELVRKITFRDGI